jgi:hypothetical protein
MGIPSIDDEGAEIALAAFMHNLHNLQMIVSLNAIKAKP